jgi:hypothetical protein
MFFYAWWVWFADEVNKKDGAGISAVVDITTTPVVSWTGDMIENSLQRDSLWNNFPSWGDVNANVLLADIGSIGGAVTATMMLVSAAENIANARWNDEGRKLMVMALGASVAAGAAFSNLGLEVEQTIV